LAKIKVVDLQFLELH